MNAEVVSCKRQSERACEIYGRWIVLFLRVRQNLGSKVDFVVESGLHVLTRRTSMHQSKRQLGFLSLILSFS